MRTAELQEERMTSCGNSRMLIRSVDEHIKSVLGFREFGSKSGFRGLG